MADTPTENLTEGWPDEDGNQELARFAVRVRSSRPALGEDAMARVHAAMRQEMADLSGPLPRRWVLGAASVAAAAAAVILVAGSYLGGLRHRQVSRPQAPLPVRAQGVQDTYPVCLAIPPAVLPRPSPPASPPGRPLVSLDEYQPLYADLR